MRKLSAVVLTAATVALTFTGAAHAETNPRCGSVTQIGATKYLKSGSETVASVKQFKGCDKNWGYIYVWDSWKNRHPGFDASVAIITRDSDGEIDTGSGARGQQEVWSRGANTLQYCTRAYGHVFVGSTRYDGMTEERC